ncbi:putative major facilitator superfamily transporter protein [Rosellinia necatrix]|uniref:Putative major facilitator superfamily transporter protein n=1 Tax=Rosellinia necatrix TaxID=77044 RepID=A0A1S8A6E0_ROSNE|nr:putative major facilitator superfamily transporter protein [Rosellinia necatrix]
MSTPNTSAASSRPPLDDGEKAEPVPRTSSSSSHDSKSSRDIRSSSSSFAPRAGGDAEQQDQLERCSTKHSAIGDAPIQPIDSIVEIPDEFYNRLPAHRKTIILALMSFSAFLSPVSSTSVLAATPEVASEYDTTGSIVNLVNALYLFFMGLSPIVWGPLSQV